MDERKHTRRLLYTIKPTQFSVSSNRKIYPPKYGHIHTYLTRSLVLPVSLSLLFPYSNMMEILRDREHLEYFRNFLATRGEVSEEAPLQFWLAVEELKKHVHNTKKYKSIIQRIRERYLTGNPYKSEIM